MLCGNLPSSSKKIAPHTEITDNRESECHKTFKQTDPAKCYGLRKVSSNPAILPSNQLA